ncbi:MAG: hypothetical protein F6K09_03210 [Merismopedia sp. SIO2A8]|nr:hypothetical protein [Merismopedia sp. SIO2A8]
MERGLILAYDAEEKISIKQRIQEEIKPQIYQTETEYWQFLIREINSLVIDEADASNAIFEVIQTAEVVEQNKTNQYPVQVIQLLTEIKNKLSEPGKSSVAKLKAAVPLLPPFISYEMEIETEGILRRMFPTFSRLLKKVEKK